jgi:WD40 repeat protein
MQLMDALVVGCVLSSGFALQSAPDPTRVFTGHSGQINSIAFSPDGKRILTASSDGTARIWDVQSGSLVKVLRYHTDSVNQAVFSPDGSYILTASSDQTLGFWSATGEFETAVDYSIPVFSVAYSRDGTRLAVHDSTSIHEPQNNRPMTPVICQRRLESLNGPPLLQPRELFVAQKAQP